MIRILLLVLLLCSVSTKPQAHPHAWIDMETTVLFDDNGQVKGVRVGWLFDDFYSAFSLDGVEATPKALNELAEINLKNLEEYDYFTKIKIDSKYVDIQKVTSYNTEMIGNRLWLEFDVLMDTSINPTHNMFSYSVYDPTYYVEVLHALDGDPIRLDGNAGNCAYALKNPEPPEDIALIAAAMDQTQTAGDTIGQYFAETVTLSCQ